MKPLERVLVANRGEIARRLIRFFKAAGTETVAVFSEPDLEQPFVEEADYSAYLNGRTVAETYLDPQRVVAAAMDAGCDAIHPGYCFLAERPDFVRIAAGANLPVIGADPAALVRAADRFEVRRVAKELQIPLIPATEALPESDDGVAWGAQLGFPLYVKTPGGGVVRRVESLADLPAAVADVRAEGRVVNGDASVYLERAVDRLRRVGTTVVGDRHGTVVWLGHTDASLQFDFRTWVEEMGPATVAAPLSQRLGTAAAELARHLGWVGPARVRWALTPDGGWYLLGLSGRLVTGFDLVEDVCGVDLLTTQLSVQAGEPLGWQQADVKLERHGVQARVLGIDPERPDQRPQGRIRRLSLPDSDEGLTTVTGTAEGQPCNADTDPLLVKVTATAPTRHAALVRARAALEALVLEGVPTNQQMLIALLADETVWSGDIDVHTVGRMLGTLIPGPADAS